MLLMLSMVVMYSISCPLITPFGRLCANSHCVEVYFWYTHIRLGCIQTTVCPGLVYFLFKHFVDKHNLAFVYARSKINKNVHRLNDALKWENSFTVLPRLTQCVQYCSLVTRFGLNSNSFQHCIFRSAINFVMFSVGLLQVFMLSFSFIRWPPNTWIYFEKY